MVLFEKLATRFYYAARVEQQSREGTDYDRLPGKGSLRRRGLVCPLFPRELKGAGY